jgi:hypothetical protein
MTAENANEDALNLYRYVKNVRSRVTNVVIGPPTAASRGLSNTDTAELGVPVVNAEASPGECRR